jgi:hypothetical protein
VSRAPDIESQLEAERVTRERDVAEARAEELRAAAGG